MFRPILSVLICTVPNRRQKANELWDKLSAQSPSIAVEILMLCDNRMRTIGAKRQALLDIARGEYVAFADDDDDIADDYIESIFGCVNGNARVHHDGPDLVVFPIRVTIDGKEDGIVEPSIQYAPKNGEALAEYKPPVTYRPPHELLVWKSDIAKRGRFPDTSCGEDFEWAAQCWPHVRTEVRIDKVLYHWKGRASGAATVGA